MNPLFGSGYAGLGRNSVVSGLPPSVTGWFATHSAYTDNPMPRKRFGRTDERMNGRRTNTTMLELHALAKYLCKVFKNESASP